MYNILDYGAVADRKTVITKALQQAIDACAANGGGRVLVPAGEYITGSVFLKDHVELHLEMGAVLWGSTDPADYNSEDAYPQNWGSTTEQWRGQHLIMAVEANDVALTGLGTIDGRGDYFFGGIKWRSAYAWRYGFTGVRDQEILRPGQSVCFIECTNVRVTDITIRNATCWACFLYGCEQVQIRGCKMNSDRTFANTDGIDIDCCRYVTVSDCVILTGDDALTVRCSSKRLKTYRPCEYITVSNCVMRASACGIRFGVGVGEINHVRVRGLVIEDAGTAFLIQTRYGANCSGKLQNIDVSDVTVGKTGRAIVVSAPSTGYVRHVSFSNMRIYAYAGCTVENTDAQIEDVVFRDIDLTLIQEGEEFFETEDSRKLRGNHAMRILNAKNVTLDTVRVFFAPEVAHCWEGALKAENSPGLQVLHCNF